MRRFAAVLGLCLALTELPAAAADADGYTTVVIAAETGEVLHAVRADAPRKPASLAKLMTIYLLLEALEDGEIGLGDPIRVSAHAAAQPPVKLGLEKGETIRALDAFKALVVRSSNDVAVAVAERLARDEARFADRMTAKAAELGMTRTRFKNATGLPHPDDTTTARDMAVLAEALRRDFPAYYGLFSVPSLVWGGELLPNHNRVLYAVDGADGLKTGYTREAGYTLAASAGRDGQRVIVVVMGAPSLDARATFAADLFDAAFAELERRAPALVYAEDRPRDAVILRASADEPPRGVRIIVEPAGAASVDPAPAESEPADLEPVKKPVDEAAAAAPARPDWGVQVGAYNTAAAAEARLSEVLDLAAADLRGAVRLVAPAENSGSLIWRARLIGVDESAARAACAKVAASGGGCFVVGAD